MHQHAVKYLLRTVSFTFGLSLLVAACGSSDDDSAAEAEARAKAAADDLCALEFSANCDYNPVYASEESCRKSEYDSIEKYPLCNDAVATFFECRVKNAHPHCRESGLSDSSTVTDLGVGNLCEAEQKNSFKCFDDNYPDDKE